MLKKYSIRKSENGIALMEIMVSLSLSVIIAIGAIWALIAFFNKYEEYKLRTFLYQDSFNALTQIKGGLALGTGNDTYFYGVSSASELGVTRGFSNIEGKGLKVIPSIQVGGYFDYSEYYFNGSKLLGTYLFQSISPPSPIVLFPTKHQDKIFVTDFNVEMLNTPMPSEVQEFPGEVVRVTLEAELRYKDKVHPVRYSTIMTTFK